MTKATNRIGRIGERLAERWLVDRGYAVVARNWRRHGDLRGELDLVAWAPDGTLVICEVKTRRHSAPDVPLYAVNWAKQRQLRALAVAFLAAEVPHADRVRFDVIAVSWPAAGGPADVLHVQDAL